MTSAQCASSYKTGTGYVGFASRSVPGDHLRDIFLADHVQMPGNAHAHVHGADRGNERRALLMRGAGRFRAGDLGKAGKFSSAAAP